MTRKRIDSYHRIARQEIDRLKHLDTKCSLHIEMHYSNKSDNRFCLILFAYKTDGFPNIIYMQSSSENERVLEMLAELRAKVDEVLNENRDTK